jgi:hypothetical protein
MHIELLPYERKTLEALEKQFQLPRERVVGLALSLNDITRLFEEVAGDGTDEFRAGRVVLAGFLNHAHHLLNGGLQALLVGNAPVWSACVRGLMETFGACVLISEQPEKAPNYLEHVKAGQLRAAAERGRTGLGSDIDRLNQIVHPVSGAIFANIVPISLDERSVSIRFGLHARTPDESREGFVVLANLATLLAEKLEHLRSRPEVLSSGKPTLIRRT